MTKRWTDEDVERLVDAAESMAGNVNIVEELSYSSINLHLLLAPFRPDPEEELLTSMCIEFDKVWNHTDCFAKETDSYRKARVDCMRAALAVVKEKGLPTT